MSQNHDFKSLPLSDPFMFAMAMHDEDICKLLLGYLLGNDVGPLRFIDDALGLCGPIEAHSHGLGVYLAGKDGTRYYITTGTNKEEVPKAGRYYASAITAQLMEAEKNREDMDENWGEGIPDCYIVIVCGFDATGGGLPRYTVVQRVTGVSHSGHEISHFLDDGVRHIILNAEYTKENFQPRPILEFLDYFRNADDKAAFTTPLAQKVVEAVKKVRQSKEVEEDYMTYQMKLNDSYRRGSDAKLTFIVKRMLKTMTPEQVAEIVDESPKTIQDIMSEPDVPKNK